MWSAELREIELLFVHTDVSAVKVDCRSEGRKEDWKGDEGQCRCPHVGL